MLAGVTEHFDYKVGNAIGDLRLIREARGRIHKYVQLDTPPDAVEITQRRLQLRDDIVAAQSRRFLPILDLELLAQLPDVFELPIPNGHLTRNEGLVAGDDDGHVIGHGRRRL